MYRAENECFRLFILSVVTENGHLLCSIGHQGHQPVKLPKYRKRALWPKGDCSFL